VSGGAWIAFLAAAGAGAPARYLVDVHVQARLRSAFPWGTLVVNVTGCLLLGVLVGLGRYHGLGSTLRTVLGTGALGAYTTFSTVSADTVRLAEQGAVGLAVRNAVGSSAAGLAAAASGLALAALLG